MKKNILAVLSLLTAGLMNAATGDTTTITSHQLQKLSWYENYDSVATFPDGTTSYRAIIAEFELGKYMCEGYDPSNAGEGAGQTGWCGDWDYDVHLIAMTASGDTIELGELITPYANSNFPNLPWSWKHKYNFDVTDYYNVLRDDVTIRIFYAGWSGGFTATVKFHFIEGPRHRDVLGHEKLYHGYYNYGLATNPIETNVSAKTINIPTGTVISNFNTIITGHGNVNENCAEFCSKWMKYKVNGTEVATRQIWRDDCGNNWLSPQSGTWIYNRANWCPGNKVEPMKVKLNSLVSGPHEVDIDFQPFTATGEGAAYRLYSDVIYYGNYSHEHNAGIEKILVPTDDEEERKSNPACANPSILVKNYGTSTITSIKIEYGISTANNFTYTGSIAPDESAIINLPDFGAQAAALGAENTFYAKILEVNGTPDTEFYNNHRTSKFTSTGRLFTNKIKIQLKTSGALFGTFNTVNWKLYDANDVLVKERTGTASSFTYEDTVELTNGCYKLVTNTPRGFGLSFFSAYSPKGFVRLFNALDGVRIPMYDNDLGATGLEGNFGTGFTHYFHIGDPLGLTPDNNFVATVYPNPAKDEVNIKLYRQLHNKAVSIIAVDALGKEVYQSQTTEDFITIPTRNWSNGLYYIRINDGNKSMTEKVVLIK